MYSPLSRERHSYAFKKWQWIKTTINAICDLVIEAVKQSCVSFLYANHVLFLQRSGRIKDQGGPNYVFCHGTYIRIYHTTSLFIMVQSHACLPFCRLFQANNGFDL